MAKLHGRKISNRTVEGLSVGDKDAVFWDRELLGFGVRVYPSGAKVYVVQTWSEGRSRRVTVGRHGVISAARARRRAALMLARLRAGEEPLPPRAAPPVEAGATVSDLAERFLREYVAVRCKPWTMMTYRGALDGWILPALGRLPVGTVTHAHVADLHYRLRDIPYRANQVVAILNRMFSLAEVWGLRRAGPRRLRPLPPLHRSRGRPRPGGGPGGAPRRGAGHPPPAVAEAPGRGRHPLPPGPRGPQGVAAAENRGRRGG